MNVLFGLSLHLASWLITYCIYSTVLLGGLWLGQRPLRKLAPNLRCWFWKCALLLPAPLAGVSLWVPNPAWLPCVPLWETLVPETTGSHASAVNRAVMAAQLRSERQLPASGMSASTSANFLRSSALPATPPWHDRWEIFQHPAQRRMVWPTLVALWIAGSFAGCWRLTREAQRLTRLKRQSQLATQAQRVCLCELQQRAHLTQPVELLVSSEIDSPLTGGIRRPFILIPLGLGQRMSAAGWSAVLAHELAHIARRDACWNLGALLISRIFFFQPLHGWLRRELRRDTEFCADEWAARILKDRVQLARCLAELGDWLIGCRPRQAAPQPLAVGMGAFRSGLGSRVAALLETPAQLPGDSRGRPRWLWAAILLCPCGMLLTVPRAQPRLSSMDPSILDTRSSEMKWAGTSLALLSSWMISGVSEAQETQKTPPATAAVEPAQPAEAGKPQGVPPEMENFSGMLIGTLVSRDAERGEFTVKLQYVARVWENNKARQPRAGVGKTVVVEGVTGKWLDNLLLLRPGDTVEFEALHRRGERLTFPGEWLRKVPAFDPADHPSPPDGFRGFSGILLGKITAKQEESGEMIVEVDALEKTGEKNRAEQPETILGKPIVLAGFWGKMRPPFDELKVGDRIRAGVVHRAPQSDHFSLSEVIEKVPANQKTAANPKDEPQASGFPAGMRGFRGILQGEVVSRDVEKGELVIVADKATRVWKQNAATDVKSCAGQRLVTQGISGRFLDVLLTLKPGDTVEVEAFHNRGEQLDFVGEWLRKVE